MITSNASEKISVAFTTYADPHEDPCVQHVSGSQVSRSRHVENEGTALICYYSEEPYAGVSLLLRCTSNKLLHGISTPEPKWLGIRVTQ